MTPAQAWYAVAILTIANVSGFVDRQILSLLVEPIKRDLKVTDTQVSLLMGLGFVVFYSLLGLPIGRWVDRGHRPRIVALGALVDECALVKELQSGHLLFFFFNDTATTELYTY